MKSEYQNCNKVKPKHKTSKENESNFGLASEPNLKKTLFKLYEQQQRQLKQQRLPQQQQKQQFGCLFSAQTTHRHNKQ